MKKGGGLIVGKVVHTTPKTATVDWGEYPVIMAKSRLRKVPWNFMIRVMKDLKERIR